MVEYSKSPEFNLYGYFDKAGTPFFFWFDKKEGPKIAKEDYLRDYYTSEKLNGEFEIRLLAANIAYFDALTLNEKLLAEHAGTALNRNNRSRHVDMEVNREGHRLRDQIWPARQLAASLEKSSPDEAVRHYLAALKAHTNSQLTGSGESGLYGKLMQELAMKGAGAAGLDILDRVSIVLCKQGRAQTALDHLEAYLQTFPDSRNSDKANKIFKRVRSKLP